MISIISISTRHRNESAFWSECKLYLFLSGLAITEYLYPIFVEFVALAFIRSEGYGKMGLFSGRCFEFVLFLWFIEDIMISRCFWLFIVVCLIWSWRSMGLDWREDLCFFKFYFHCCLMSGISFFLIFHILRCFILDIRITWVIYFGSCWNNLLFLLAL